MNFLQTIVSNPPLLLKPDRPSSVHLLSWQQFQLDEASSSLNKQREQELIVQSSELSLILKEKQRQFSSQTQKYLQHLLLYQIQNDRLRHILSEWDAQRKKFQERSKELDGIYQHKLQLLKIDLAKGFEGQLQEIADRNNRDLEQIRGLYSKRLAQVNTESNNYEDSIDKLRMEVDRKHTRIQILQTSAEDILLRLDVKTKQFREREVQVGILKEQLRGLRDQENFQREQRYQEGQRQRQEVEQLRKENEELKDRLQEWRGNLQDMRDQVNFAELQRVRAQEKKEQCIIRCLTLEKQIEEFKFRKTQHNQISDINNRSVTGVKHSPHHSYKTLEVKMGQDQKLKDSRRIDDENVINSLNARVEELEEQLAKVSNQLEKAEQVIHDHQERIKDQVEIVGREKVWAERLAVLQKVLDELNQQWLKKERELGTLFKNLESGYVLKLQQKQKMLKQTLGELHLKYQECKQLSIALADKAMQLGMLQMQLNQKKK